MDLKIDTIILSFGYVESAMLGNLICTNNFAYFDNERAAIKHLSDELLAKYKHRFMKSNVGCKECETNAADYANMFCRKCGTKLKRVSFDSLDFEEWLRKLPVMSLDEYGYDDECDGVEMTWQVGMMFDDLFSKMEEEVIFVEYAEQRILLSLGLFNEDD